MNAQPSSSPALGLPGVLAALAGSSPCLQPAVLHDGAPAGDMEDTSADTNACDDWTSDFLKRLSVRLKSLSVIGFGHSIPSD
jgi:hypothetical protein